MLPILHVTLINLTPYDNFMLPCFLWSILLNYYSKFCIYAFTFTYSSFYVFIYTIIKLLFSTLHKTIYLQKNTLSLGIMAEGLFIGIVSWVWTMDNDFNKKRRLRDSNPRSLRK